MTFYLFKDLYCLEALKCSVQPDVDETGSHFPEEQIQDNSSFLEVFVRDGLQSVIYNDVVKVVNLVGSVCSYRKATNFAKYKLK